MNLDEGSENGGCRHLPYVYRLSRYDPADRDEYGHYISAEDVRSDHGPVEAAYLAAVAAFAGEAGIVELQIREPEVAGIANFGVKPPVAGHGLAGLFLSDLTGYHDGAQVSLAVGLELVRAMLRDNGAWCRLVRARLAPRARLLVWPDLSADVGAVLAGLPAEGFSEIVWQDHDGNITNRCVDEDDYPALPALLAAASSVMVLSCYADERHPLLAAVLPDADGVLRARWAT